LRRGLLSPLLRMLLLRLRLRRPLLMLLRLRLRMLLGRRRGSFVTFRFLIIVLSG
jgi:hypothetical protein